MKVIGSSSVAKRPKRGFLFRFRILQIIMLVYLILLQHLLPIALLAQEWSPWSPQISLWATSPALHLYALLVRPLTVLGGIWPRTIRPLFLVLALWSTWTPAVPHQNPALALKSHSRRWRGPGQASTVSTFL